LEKLTKELELMLELDRLEKKVIVLKNKFKDFPTQKSNLNKEISDLKRSLSAEQEHYEEQKLEISFLKDELTEIHSKIENISKSLDKDYDEELANLLTDKNKLFKLREEELKASETLLKDTIDVVKESEDKYREVKEKNNKTIERLTSEKETFESEMKALRVQQDEIFKELGDLDSKEDLVALYNRISEAFPGGVISKIKNASCSRCFIEVTPQLLNELYREAVAEYRTGEIITCPSCRCIIYIDPNEVE
jgi:predicted  nucleic acid-binding Zn-ribbon protein